MQGTPAGGSGRSADFAHELKLRGEHLICGGTPSDLKGTSLARSAMSPDLKGKCLLPLCFQAQCLFSSYGTAPDDGHG